MSMATRNLYDFVALVSWLWFRDPSFVTLVSLLRIRNTAFALCFLERKFSQQRNTLGQSNSDFIYCHSASPQLLDPQVTLSGSAGGLLEAGALELPPPPPQPNSKTVVSKARPNRKALRVTVSTSIKRGIETSKIFLGRKDLLRSRPDFMP